MTGEPLHSGQITTCADGVVPVSSSSMNELQNAIDSKYLELATATTAEARRSAWNELQALIKSRPPKEVERLERERGLRQ